MSNRSTKPSSAPSTPSHTGRHVHTKTLADGTTKTYTYPRKPKGEPSPTLARAGTIGACQMLYKESPEWRALKPITQAHYLTYLRYWEPFWQRRIEEIDRRQIISLRNGIAERRGDQAGNVFTRVTGAWFGWLVDNDWLQHSPVVRIKRIPGGGHLSAWNDAQYQHAVAHLPEYLRRVVVLARHTGQRRGDLIALTWANYDGQGNVASIRLRQQKGHKRDEMRIPLLPEARDELDAWKRDARSTFILTTDRGVPWNPTYLSRLLGEAVIALGLPNGLNVHGLRKLAATTLAEAGCSTHEIMAITGHPTLGMVELYTASARQEQLATAAIVRLGDHRKGTG